MPQRQGTSPLLPRNKYGWATSPGRDFANAVKLSDGAKARDDPVPMDSRTAAMCSCPPLPKSRLRPQHHEPRLCRLLGRSADLRCLLGGVLIEIRIAVAPR